MTITYRSVKDEALTYAEMDENFRDLRQDTTLQRVLTNGNTSNLIINIEQINASYIVANNLNVVNSTVINETEIFVTSNTITANAITSNTITANAITSNTITANTITVEQISLIPSGTLFPYAGNAEPTGYLFCTGNAVSRTTYSTLFAAIGTTYGPGDNSTTFNLPDLRGRVIAGRDNMSGTAANRLTSNVAGSTLGATGGVQSHTLTIAEMPLHGHPTRVSTGTTAADGNGGMMLDSGSDANYAAHTTAPTSTAGDQVGGEGGGGSHNNVQPTIILNYIIKT